MTCAASSTSPLVFSAHNGSSNLWRHDPKWVFVVWPPSYLGQPLWPDVLKQAMPFGPIFCFLRLLRGGPAFLLQVNSPRHKVWWCGDEGCTECSDHVVFGRMITDDQLGVFVNILGAVTFVLIVYYHYVVAGKAKTD